MNWKGDKAQIGSIHRWMDSHYGRPKFCEACGVEEANVFEWANISGKYLRTRDDFLRLCRSCHRKFDFTEEKKVKAMANLWWVKGVPIGKVGRKFQNAKI